MAIRYVAKGDIRDDPSSILVCAVNCVAGVMGAGQARAFKDRWPGLVEHHRLAVKQGRMGPGLPTIVSQIPALRRPDGSEFCVVLFPTKEDWRNPSRLEWVANGLRVLVRTLKLWNATDPRADSIAVPALGCGLGGLEWGQVRPLIEMAELRTPDIAWTIYLPGAERYAANF